MGVVLLARTTSCLREDQEEVGRDRDGGHRRGHGRGHGRGRGLACRGPFFGLTFPGWCFYYLGPRSQPGKRKIIWSPLSDKRGLNQIGWYRQILEHTQLTLAKHTLACHSFAGPFNSTHYPVSWAGPPSEGTARVSGWVCLSVCEGGGRASMGPFAGMEGGGGRARRGMNEGGCRREWRRVKGMRDEAEKRK